MFLVLQQIVGILDNERTRAVEPLVCALCGRVVDQRPPVVIGAVLKIGGDPPQAEGVRLALDECVLRRAGRAEAVVVGVLVLRVGAGADDERQRQPRPDASRLIEAPRILLVAA